MEVIGEYIDLMNKKELSADLNNPKELKVGKIIEYHLEFNTLQSLFKNKIIELQMEELKDKGLEVIYAKYNDEVNTAVIQVQVTKRYIEIQREKEEEQNDPERDYSDPDYWNDPHRFKALLNPAALFTFKAGIAVGVLTSLLTNYFVYATVKRVYEGEAPANFLYKYAIAGASVYIIYTLLKE